MRKSLLLWLVALALALAQSKTPGVGHWEGAIQAPDREVKMALDLAQNDKGEWSGSFDLPDMRVDGAPLGNIVVKGTSVSFAIQGAPGAPGFQGQISQDGKELKGDLSTPGGTVPAVLKWVSEPKVKVPPKSTPITKDMEGTWEGKLTAPNGNELRLRVRLANGAEGATGILNSLDQGGQDLPLAGITQNGTALKFELKIVGGLFEGQLKDGALVGEWSQGNSPKMPLTFKRPAEEKK